MDACRRHVRRYAAFALHRWPSRCLYDFPSEKNHQVRFDCLDAGRDDGLGQLQGRAGRASLLRQGVVRCRRAEGCRPDNADSTVVPSTATAANWQPDRHQPEHRPVLGDRHTAADHVESYAWDRFDIEDRVQPRRREHVGACGRRDSECEPDRLLSLDGRRAVNVTRAHSRHIIECKRRKQRQLHYGPPDHHADLAEHCV